MTVCLVNYSITERNGLPETAIQALTLSATTSNISKLLAHAWPKCSFMSPARNRAKAEEIIVTASIDIRPRSDSDFTIGLFAPHTQRRIGGGVKIVAILNF